jgi:hypothetical protein
VADIAIINQTVTAEPKDYLVPGTQELLLKSVRASVDGSGTASAYLPALQMIAPDGTVMWQAVPTTTVAAGASADVTWFPGLNQGASFTASGKGLDLVATVANPTGYTATTRAFFSNDGTWINLWFVVLAGAGFAAGSGNYALRFHDFTPSGAGGGPIAGFGYAFTAINAVGGAVPIALIQDTSNVTLVDLFAYDPVNKALDTYTDVLGTAIGAGGTLASGSLIGIRS